MPKLLLVWLYGGLLCPLLVQAQYETLQERRSFYFYLARHYMPEALPLLAAVPDTAFFGRFAEGGTQQDALDAFNTLVHESLHWYNYQQGGFWHENYYIKPGQDLRTRRRFVFNSVALNAIVPVEVQARIFRYHTYIGDSSRVGSQVNGFYGILEEFGAYYYGTKADLSLYPYYQTFCQQSGCWMKKFLGNTLSTLHAYYEFRLFMAWYLRYASLHEPEVYEGLMNDLVLRKAYTLINRDFTDLVSNFFVLREELLDSLRAAGVRLWRQDDSIMVFDPNRKVVLGYDTFDQELIWLKSLMSAEDEALLDRFALPD
ncbi:MAG: hypothetical protein ACFCUI_07875 [Bernardetiaceae bacterium]